MAFDRRLVARALLALWLVGGSFLGAILLVRHVVALPTPAAADATLRGAIQALAPAARWRAVHVMYRACPCSRRTIDHLLADPLPPMVDQVVVMVDDAGEAGPEDVRLRAAGLRVELVTPGALRARYHVEAAPLLVVMNPDDEIVYVGGYNRHKQSPAYEDHAIVAELVARHPTRARPVFGCATSARLATLVDPLGLDRLR